MDGKAQLNIESLIAIPLLVIMYIILAAYVFQPIFTAFQPSLENTSGNYGTMASTILLILIYFVMPVMIIMSAFLLLRPKYEVQQ
jgi:hypothetical protein